MITKSVQTSSDKVVVALKSGIIIEVCDGFVIVEEKGKKVFHDIENLKPEN